MANGNTGSTLEERVTEVLRSIQMSSPDVIGTAVVDVQGFIIASAFPSGVNDEELGAMSATLHGSGEQIAEQLMHAPMAQTYVKTEKGYVKRRSVWPGCTPRSSEASRPTRQRSFRPCSRTRTTRKW